MVTSLRTPLEIAKQAMALYFAPFALRHNSPRSRQRSRDLVPPPNKLPIQSLIGEGIYIEGNIRGTRRGLRIDGNLTGNIQLEGGLIVISETAYVEGDIDTGYIIVNGTVKGNLVASHAIELQPRAIIDGNVKTAVLEMHKGAAVRGRMEASEEPHSPKFEAIREEVRELAREQASLRRVK